MYPLQAALGKRQRKLLCSERSFAQVSFLVGKVKMTFQLVKGRDLGEIWALRQVAQGADREPCAPGLGREAGTKADRTVTNVLASESTIGGSKPETNSIR